jgi:hypothetical protein
MHHNSACQNKRLENPEIAMSSSLAAVQRVLRSPAFLLRGAARSSCWKKTGTRAFTKKGLVSEKEAAAIHGVAVAGLEQFGQYLDAGAISAARELITANAKMMPIGHALASADTSKPN